MLNCPFALPPPSVGRSGGLTHHGPVVGPKRVGALCLNQRSLLSGCVVGGQGQWDGIAAGQTAASPDQDKAGHISAAAVLLTVTNLDLAL